MRTSYSRIGPGFGKNPDSHKIQVKYGFWFFISVGDPDPQNSHDFGLPVPDPLFRGTDLYLDPSLSS
jgi:hypothetical protein